MDSDQTKRVLDYIATLKEGGAGHQTQLADDLQALVDAKAVKAADDKDAKIKNLQASVESLIDERDAARDELKALKAHGIAKPVKEEEHAAIKAKAHHVGAVTTAAKPKHK